MHKQQENASAKRQKTGVLLINLGSPESTEVKDVRHYLGELLSDKRVVDLPSWKWQIILHGVVLRKRPKRTAQNYQKIWTKDGSPLIHATETQAQKLEALFKEDGLKVSILPAMTYGKPSIEDALKTFSENGISKVVCVPLFPQYASSVSAAALDKVWRALLTMRCQPEIVSINHFFDFPAYIHALSERIISHWAKTPRSEHLIFSFHGIPESAHLLGEPYKEQCMTTAYALAKALNLDTDDYSIAFQSQFGKEQWIQPATQQVLAELPQKGIQSLDVVCPGFICDCVETLEEMAISGKKIFQTNGGKTFHYIPCLNDDPLWIEALYQLIKPRISTQNTQ